MLAALPAAKPHNRRSWQEASLPSLPDIPAMTKPAERQMFYWLTSSRFTGAGAVVELGCSLGAGTAALAAGLRDRGSSARVLAVDRFRWKSRQHALIFDPGLADGDDFEPLFREYTRALGSWIEPVNADLAEFRWDRGPIEILIVDAPKRRADVMRFLEVFSPALMPGRSLVAFQDYLHEPSYALPALLACCGDVFKLVDVALPGSTALFEVHGTLLLDAERRRTMDILRWSAAETVQHWQQNVLRALPRKAHLAARITLALLLHDQGHREAALSEFRRAAKEPKAWLRLQRLAEKPLYFHYKNLFKPFGVKPKRLSHELYLDQAKAYLKAGRIEAAHEVCRMALASAPTHPGATALMARIERKRRLWHQAVRALRRLVGHRRPPRRLR